MIKRKLLKSQIECNNDVILPIGKPINFARNPAGKSIFISPGNDPKITLLTSNFRFLFNFQKLRLCKILKIP
jgi:hypothetical protein